MKKILAVDDSRTLRDMLISCLKNAGHEVYSAQDGAEALERLREHRPDIVITDLNMPVMDGLDFIEAARQEEAGRDVPVHRDRRGVEGSGPARGRDRLVDQTVRRNPGAESGGAACMRRR